MLKQTELEWHRYQSQLKARRDRAAELIDVHKEGREEGREKGREEGRAEGIAIGDVIGRIHAFQGLLGQPLTPQSDLLALSMDQLRAKAAELEREVTARLQK